MKLQNKMLLGYLVVASVLALTSLIAFTRVRSLATAGQTIAEAHRHATSTREVRTLLADMRAGQRELLVTNDAQTLAQFEELWGVYQRAVDRLRTLNREHPSHVEKLDEIGRLSQRWHRLAALPQISRRRATGTSPVDERDPASPTVAAPVAEAAGEDLLGEIRRQLDLIIEGELLLIAQKERGSAGFARASQWLIGIVTAAALVLGLLAMRYMSRTVLEQVGGEPATIAAIAERVTEGDLAVELPGDDESTTGILASVRKMVVALRANRNAAETNDWLKSGSTRINEVMRGEELIGELGGKVVSEVCTHLDAKVGALYFLDATRTASELELVGSYAYERRKNLSSRFGIGEGVVGQAALEKKPILVKNVPEDYVKVTSGLGEILPRFICVNPLIHDERVVGVLELGMLSEPTAHELDYLSQCAPAIAITLSGLKGRADLAHALSRAETLSGDLQEQREELRTSNEELEERAQELQQSQHKLRAQQEEMAVINEELEETNETLTTQKREVEAARKAITKKAEDLALASKYKSEFLANMSHELRTPLNSLLLLAHSLADNKAGNLSEDQVRSAGVIHGSGQDLLALIDEILDLSKIEAGRMTLDISPVALGKLARAIEDGFGHVAAEKNLTFAVEIGTEAPDEITTDHQRLLQVLKNLISNALKFTTDGTVRVAFERARHDVDLARSGLDPRTALAITVADTGIGIAPDQRALIFEAFQQADGTTARRYGGTGLGLAISRELTGLLGGEIQLESDVGHGSTFTLYMPPVLAGAESADGPSNAAPGMKRAAPKAAAPAELTSTLADTDIEDDRTTIVPEDEVVLVIEDDARFAQILADRCHHSGSKCIVAHTGEKGLKLAIRHRPSAVVLDIQLPGMDGWEVLDRIKANTDIRHIPVHVMSVEPPTTKALRAGAIGHLRKPVTPEALSEALAKLHAAAEPNSRRVLIVEDNDNARKAIADLVSGQDVEVDEASGAQEAIAAVQQRRYDCMILDLGLWDMDGEAMLAAIEQSAEAHLPPVIVHTGRDLTSEEEMRLQHYTESIIIKDARSEERLLDEVSLFLHRVVDQMPATKRQTILDLHRGNTVFHGKNLLIVEDDMRSSFALTKLLTERGMTVLQAENGERALHLLEDAPAVDLVLMDIMMPVMDGYEAIRLIRAEQRFAKLPIIALTAKAMKEDAESCLAVGANDYLAKPVDIERLLSMMRVWLYA